MEKSEVENVCPSLDDGGQLNRSRSFKTKQLVRSQAIREAQSPPRTCSPTSSLNLEPPKDVTKTDVGNETPTASGSASDASSHASDVSCSDRTDEEGKKQSVEIQITHDAWESEHDIEQRQHEQGWIGHRHNSECPRDLLSKEPRVTCICGACGACPHCKGRRRKPFSPTKEDSGIACSEDCPECSESEQIDSPKDGATKSGSSDEDEAYCRCKERTEKPKDTLSRTDSDDKTEPTGPELVDFIKLTLNKNPRDRIAMLKIEKELHNFINDPGRCIMRFPIMTSYGRMLVHRCAALFQLSHHLDQANKTSVLVSKTGTCGGRIPCTIFKEWCTTTFPCSPQHRRDDTLAKSILKRSAAPGEEACGAVGGAARSKSLEQRERDYERVRRRIFSSDNCTQDEAQWPWLTSGPVKLLTSEGRNKLVKVQSLESRGCEAPRVRGAVSKSHSFGGYAADPPNHRLLSKQGDLASSSWRLSPSSSGYKTLSLRSTDSVTPSPTGGASPEPAVESGTLVWAVTDLSAVPPGALVIHPQTGRPLTNPDGSLYHFDPANPLILHDASVFLQHDQFKIDPNNDKRRGRLEKQNSFIDNECECRPAEESRTKCSYEEPCNKNASGKEHCQPEEPEQKLNSIPPSPSKGRLEQNNETIIANADATPNEPEIDQQTPEPQVQSIEPPIQETVYEEAEKPIVYDNQRPLEPKQSSYEAPANHKHIYENQYGSPSHRTPSLEQQKALESANQRKNDVASHRLINKLYQDGQDMTQYTAQANYVQRYRNDEVQSPMQAIPNPAYIQADMANLHNVMMQAKVAPVPIPDPNIRPMSLTNVMYPSAMPQGFPFVNPCRLDQPMQPMFQQMVPQQVEEPKQHPTPPHNDTTFRIDPSYPYATDFNAACGACTGTCDPVSLQPQHRGYNMAYGQMELPQYPVGNVMLPQQIPHYPVNQYQEAVQWPVPAVAPPKLLVQELYPVVYPNVYPQYNVVYPPVIQQPYQLCQPVYPVIDKQMEAPRRNSVTSNHRLSKHNSISGSARNTPDDKPQFEDKNANREVTNSVPNMEGNPNLNRQNSNEITVKIQQIKEQMTHLNTQDRDSERNFRRDEWKRRNSGSGILGNYPINNHFNGRVMGRTPNEDTQLSTAARAIVNSIRNMQARNNFHHDNRRNYEYTPQYHRHDNRDDYSYRNRQRQEREQENKSADKPVNANNYNQKRTGDHFQGERRFEGMQRNRNLNPMPFQYRPPYLFRQMSPGTWCRRSPGPVHPMMNHPRRPYPDTRNGRR